MQVHSFLRPHKLGFYVGKRLLVSFEDFKQSSNSGPTQDYVYPILTPGAPQKVFNRYLSSSGPKLPHQTNTEPKFTTPGLSWWQPWATDAQSALWKGLFNPPEWVALGSARTQQSTLYMHTPECLSSQLCTAHTLNHFIMLTQYCWAALQIILQYPNNISYPCPSHLPSIME